MAPAACRSYGGRGRHDPGQIRQQDREWRGRLVDRRLGLERGRRQGAWFCRRLAEQAREAVDRSERGNAIIAAYEVPVEDGMPFGARIAALPAADILPPADL